jgi:hypothetical protein
MFAWILRGLVVNEFDSGKYDELITSPGGQITTITEGEATIIRFGFTDSDDEAYTFEWAGWGILYTLSWAILAVCASTYFLSSIRFATGGSLVTEKGDDEVEEIDEADMVAIPFKRVDLTFKDIHYTVKASTSDEKLEILKGVYGVVEAGRMTALMGSSGAGRLGFVSCDAGSATIPIVLTFPVLALHLHFKRKNNSDGCSRHEKEFRRNRRRNSIERTPSRGEFVSSLHGVCGAVRCSVSSAHYPRDC